jgi:hypothetical protein
MQTASAFDRVSRRRWRNRNRRPTQRCQQPDFFELECDEVAYSNLIVVVFRIEQLVELVILTGAIDSSLIDVRDAHLLRSRRGCLHAAEQTERIRLGLADWTILLIAQIHVISTYAVFEHDSTAQRVQASLSSSTFDSIGRKLTCGCLNFRDTGKASYSSQDMHSDNSFVTRQPFLAGACIDRTFCANVMPASMRIVAAADNVSLQAEIDACLVKGLQNLVLVCSPNVGRLYC